MCASSAPPSPGPPPQLSWSLRPQMQPRRSSITSYTPGPSPFSPRIRKKENPVTPTRRILGENVALCLDPCCCLPTAPKRGFPCARGRPSLSGGGCQCTLCHKTLSEVKLFRQGGKLWDDSLPGWAATASRLPPLLFPFFPGVGSKPRWETALLFSRLPAGARLKQGKTERPHGL